MPKMIRIISKKLRVKCDRPSCGWSGRRTIHSINRRCPRCGAGTVHYA